MTDSKIPPHIQDAFEEAQEKGTLEALYKFHLQHTPYFPNEICYQLAKSYFVETPEDLTDKQKSRVERKVSEKGRKYADEREQERELNQYKVHVSS